MAEWLDFEVQCTQYLNEKFGAYARFEHLGSADSTVSDIKVTTYAGRKFYMDAKLTPAQCGQFVLKPDVVHKCFVFSKKNKTKMSPQVQVIIDHMNADFEAYKEAGTAGKDIDLNDDGRTFTEWIVSAYHQKETAFFITNGYKILPICDFAQHFDVSATYRVKRSGSAAVGKRNLLHVIQYIKDKRYPVVRCCAEGDKLFVYSYEKLHNQRFVYGNFEYMFSARCDRYEVRKLSNTFHANVIFSINNKGEKGLTDEGFASLLA